MLEPVYRADSNSAVRKDMWVRLPPAAPPNPAGLDIECRAIPSDASACVDSRWLGSEYVYLLGLYLGDGCISRARRNVWRLRITLDQRYPEIIRRCESAIENVAVRRTGKVRKPGCIEVYSYWKHWACVFPQHGLGPKHHRLIELTSWQTGLVGDLPEGFLAGLIHSDGCRCINRVKGYSYPRYFFSNRSPDIRALFVRACQRVGVECRQNSRHSVSVACRGSVEKLDVLVGPKR